MWRVCKSSKIKHPGRSGGFVLQTIGRPRPALPIFQDFFLFFKSRPCYLYPASLLPIICTNSNEISTVIFLLCEFLLFIALFPPLCSVLTLRDLFHKKKLSNKMSTKGFPNGTYTRYPHWENRVSIRINVSPNQDSIVDIVPRYTLKEGTTLVLAKLLL